jgi:hypothetical protein
MQSLKNIFANSCVVFVGYGVRDEYVLRLLSENGKEQRLFGAGPHFVISSTSGEIVSPELKYIKYRTREGDHFAATTVLDVVQQTVKDMTVEIIEAQNTRVASEQSNSETAYYITDFVPAGTWQTSRTTPATGEDGHQIEFTVGLGFTNDEVPFRESTALHDLLIGLTCFDVTYLPLSALPRLRTALPEEILKDLLESRAITFIHEKSQLCVFLKKGEHTGLLSSVTLGQVGDPTPRTPAEIVRMFLKAVPGKEAAAEQLFTAIESRIVTFSAGKEVDVPSLTRDALLMPDVGRFLGIGDAVLPSKVPRWLIFPYLRLAHLVHTGVLCNKIGIQV